MRAGPAGLELSLVRGSEATGERTADVARGHLGRPRQDRGAAAGRERGGAGRTALLDLLRSNTRSVHAQVFMERTQASLK